MSTLITQPVCTPPPFPLAGRRKLTPESVMQNYKRLMQEEHDYHTQKCVESRSRGAYTCSKCLHISLFFDGTGNNEENVAHLRCEHGSIAASTVFKPHAGAA